MNRRSFFRTLSGFAAGVYAAFVPSRKGISFDDVVKLTREKTSEQPVKNLDGSYYFQYPDKILCSGRIRDKHYVFCEHTTWEIKKCKYKYGWNGFTSKIVSHIGLQDLAREPIVYAEVGDGTVILIMDSDLFICSLDEKEDGTVSLRLI